MHTKTCRISAWNLNHCLFGIKKLSYWKNLKRIEPQKELSTGRAVYGRIIIVEVVHLRNNQILINFLSEAWEPFMACGEIKHECNSNADCKMGTVRSNKMCSTLQRRIGDELRLWGQFYPKNSLILLSNKWGDHTTLVDPERVATGHAPPWPRFVFMSFWEKWPKGRSTFPP